MQCVLQVTCVMFMMVVMTVLVRMMEPVQMLMTAAQSSLPVTVWLAMLVLDVR